MGKEIIKRIKNNRLADSGVIRLVRGAKYLAKPWAKVFIDKNASLQIRKNRRHGYNFFGWIYSIEPTKEELKKAWTVNGTDKVLTTKEMFNNNTFLKTFLPNFHFCREKINSYMGFNHIEEKIVKPNAPALLTEFLHTAIDRGDLNELPQFEKYHNQLK
jgi:hypothetical protein